MNDSALPNPLAAAGKVPPPPPAAPVKKIPKPPQPMRSSVSPAKKPAGNPDTSEAVSILKEAAMETAKPAKAEKPAKAAKISVPKPAKIDAKAIERLDTVSEDVVAPKEDFVAKKEKTAPKEDFAAKKEEAAPAPPKRKVPKPVPIDAASLRWAVDKPPSKISDRVPEKVVKMSTAKVSAMAPKKVEEKDFVEKRTARVTLKSTPADPLSVAPKAPEKVPAEKEVIKTDVVKPEPIKKELVQPEKAPAAKSGVTVEEAPKRPWWKFWGKAPEIAVDSKADELLEGAERPLTEEELVHKRHEALIDSVNQICHSLEATTNRPIEVKTTDLVPLIPGENIDNLNRTQELVSGVLTQVSTRLEKAGERDNVMIESLSSMDKSITSLNDVGERTITTMDGMKGILSQVSGAMSTMQTELKQSSKRYEELCDKVQKAEAENIAKVEKLQKSTLWVNVILGVAVAVGLIAVALSKVN